MTFNSDKELILESYVSTSRKFIVDFEKFYQSLKKITNSDFYELSAHFAGEKYLSLRYTSSSDPELFDKDETIVISKPNKKARQLAAHFPEIEKIWKLAFEKLYRPILQCINKKRAPFQRCPPF